MNNVFYNPWGYSDPMDKYWTIPNLHENSRLLRTCSGMFRWASSPCLEELKNLILIHVDIGIYKYIQEMNAGSEVGFDDQPDLQTGIPIDGIYTTMKMQSLNGDINR